MTEEQIVEFRTRLTNAAGNLQAHSDDAAGRSPMEAMRLHGKAQGVRLAVSYLLEYLPVTS